MKDRTDLECLLSFKVKGNREVLKRVCEFFSNKRCKIKEVWTVSEKDGVQSATSCDPLMEFDGLSSDCMIFGLNYFGQISESRLPFSASLDLPKKILIISLESKFFHDEEFDNVGIFNSWFCLLRELSDALNPAYGFIGPEVFVESDIAADTAEKKGFAPFSKELFSVAEADRVWSALQGKVAGS